MLTPASSPPLARRCFSNLRVPDAGPIAIAYSGGGDSTALLLLAREHLSARLVAVTIDHGLRSGSSREAERAGALCARHSIAHVIKRWTGDKPATGLQDAARKARYRLLAEAADETAAAMVMTGHTLDDQCETIAMRRARGEGRGLSGIAPATLFDGRLWFVRPLLAVPRAALRDYLRAQGEDWVEDPSNLDRRFERIRIRQSDAVSPDVDAATAHRAAFAARVEDAAAAAAVLRDAAVWQFDDDGSAVLGAAAPVEREDFALALATVLARMGNTAHLPGGAALQKAMAFVRDAENGRKMTVSGCLMTKRGGSVLVTPENRNTRTAGFGFDHLLALPDLAIAEALAERTGKPALPAPPVAVYPS